MNKPTVAASILIILTLSACSPSDGEMATAVAQTEATAPTQAPPTETLEPSPTDIPTAAPTETPSSTPEPTPDPRVINIQPRLMILTVEELAEIGEYGVRASLDAYTEYAASYNNPYANLDCTKGYDGAVEFLETTGLVTGWTTYFNLQPRYTKLPESVDITALVFDSVAGPEKLIESWGQPCEFEFYDYIGDIVIGDRATLCRYEYWMPNGELSHIRYRLAIQYRNVYIGMLVYTRDDESLELEKFYEMAFLQLEKLANLPLEDEVTLAQDFTTGAGCITPPTPLPRSKNTGSGGNVIMGWCFEYRGACWPAYPKCYLVRPAYFPGSDEPAYITDFMPCVYTGEKIIIKDPQN
jgi:hypothetical protein